MEYGSNGVMQSAKPGAHFFHVILEPTNFGAQRAPLQHLAMARARPLHGEAHDLPRILQVQFFFDVRAVRLNCFWT